VLTERKASCAVLPEVCGIRVLLLFLLLIRGLTLLSVGNFVRLHKYRLRHCGCLKRARWFARLRQIKINIGDSSWVGDGGDESLMGARRTISSRHGHWRMQGAQSGHESHPLWQLDLPPPHPAGREFCTGSSNFRIRCPQLDNLYYNNWLILLNLFAIRCVFRSQNRKNVLTAAPHRTPQSPLGAYGASQTPKGNG